MTNEDVVEVVSLVMCVVMLPLFLAVFGTALVLTSPILLASWAYDRYTKRASAHR